MAITLKQLHYLVQVAESGSISLAARQLFISQPALSAAISQLEDHFGLALLIRHHARGISLTPSGAKILAHTRRLLDHADELDSLGRELGNSVRGEILVGCFSTLAPFFMPKLLNTLQKSYPELQVQLIEGVLDQVQNALLSGHTELALVYNIDLDRQLIVEPMTQVQPYVVLPTTHSLAKQPTISLSALENEPMILLDLPHSREYFRSLFSDAGLAPTIRHRTQSFELVRGLVGKGHGYSILNLQPQSSQTYDGGRVTYIPIKSPTRSLTIAIARPAGLPVTRRAEAFTDACRRFFKN